MAVVGKVQEITGEFEYEWRIEDFFSLSKEDDKYYLSPSFSFANKSWYLRMYPNGLSKHNAIGYIGVYLYKKASDSKIRIAYSIGLKPVDKKKVNNVQRYVHVFDEKGGGNGQPQFLKRSELSERKSEWLPSGNLTVVCKLHYFKSTEKADDTDKLKCSHCKEDFLVQYISSHEKKCLDKPIECPTCDDTMKLREWFDHECQLTRVAVRKLLGDLTDMLDSEEHSDVTVKVKDVEFRLHRNVLACRNPFFRSMFKTEMKEKTTGIVCIDDCEPNIFKSFVCFLYTGKIPALSNDNVCALYKTADKYQDDFLKTKCLTFMKDKITIDSFFDFIILALMHDEKELLQSATEFFSKKTIEIIEGVEWQTFMTKYPTQANELYIKAHKAMLNMPVKM